MGYCSPDLPTPVIISRSRLAATATRLTSIALSTLHHGAATSGLTAIGRVNIVRIDGIENMATGAGNDPIVAVWSITAADATAVGTTIPADAGGTDPLIKKAPAQGRGFSGVRGAQGSADADES